MTENRAFPAVIRLGRFLDLFLPEDMRRDAPERFRGRILVASSWLAAISGAFLVFLVLGLDPRIMPVRAVFFGVLFWFSITPVLLRLTGYYTALSSALLVLVTAIILVVSFRNGGLEAPVLTTLPTPIVLAFLLQGVRRAALVTGIIIGCLIIMEWLGNAGHLPAPVIPEDVRPLARRLALVVSLAATTLLIGLYAGFHRLAQMALEDEIRARIEIERNLITARNEAQAAVLLKANFLAAMTHEIRTPLTGIVGMAQLIGKQDLVAEEQQYLTDLRLSADQLLDLVNDILVFSKISTGDVAQDVEEFSPEEMITSITQMMRGRATADVRLLVDCRDLPGRLSGEAQKFQQVLINIISNAIKFTESGDIMVTARGELYGDNRCRIRVSVEDTGIGIATDKIAHLFDEFRQGEEGLTRRYGGIGLGLTIARKLLHQTGGAIDVTSVEGKGSTFNFDMPFHVTGPGKGLMSGSVARSSADPVAGHGTLSWESPKSRYRTLLQGKAVLVVDDIVLNRTLIAAMTKKLGCTDVDMAEHGRAAVAAAKDRFYDVILMDIQMPEMDGMEATACIRRLDGPIANTCIIAITANALPGDRARYLSAGLSGYIAKPVKQDVFAAEIARRLML